MPLILFVALVGVYLAACIALVGIGVWIGARVCRIERVGWGRSMLIALALAGFGVAAWATMEAAPEHRLPLSFWSSVVTVAALVILMRLLGRVGWRRAAAGAVVALLGATLLPMVAAIGVRAGGLLNSYRVATDAMAPAVSAGDGVMVDGLSPIQRWDVVVYRSPHTGEPYVHRVVGLPGESIEIAGGRIMIDGAPAEVPAQLAAINWEATARPGGLVNGREGSPMTLGRDEYFVAGDNAEFSYDSRLWDSAGRRGEQPGAVPRRAIVGVARLRYGPLERLGAVR